jgi:two-component system cell cycle response regulator DivK
MARVVVAEDDPASLELALRLVRHAGHEAVSASDGRRALEIAGEVRPQLLLLDMNLPTLDGWQIAAALRSAPWAGTLRIVAVSAAAMVHDQERAIAAGCDEFLAKPYAPRDLLAVITRQLAAARVAADPR